MHKYSNTALRLPGSSAILSAMKATMQIPDEMYREVKAKSALEGRSVRSVTVMLYTSWLRGLVPDPDAAPRLATVKSVGGKRPNLSCFGVGRRFVRKNADGPHDMASIRESIAAGRRGKEGSELIDIVASLLPFPVAEEGHHCSNRSRSSAVAPAEVLPDMSYYISDTMSISSGTPR